jgi:hypothetical protein
MQRSIGQKRRETDLSRDFRSASHPARSALGSAARILMAPPNRGVGISRTQRTTDTVRAFVMKHRTPRHRMTNSFVFIQIIVAIDKVYPVFSEFSYWLKSISLAGYESPHWNGLMRCAAHRFGYSERLPRNFIRDREFETGSGRVGLAFVLRACSHAMGSPFVCLSGGGGDGLIGGTPDGFRVECRAINTSREECGRWK